MPPPAGSHDDNPDQAPIPDFREKAMSAKEKKAFDLMRELAVQRKANKEAKAEMKEKEQDLLKKALAALDDLGLQVGKIGPAEFTSSFIRKLKVQIPLPQKPKETKPTT